MDLNIRLMTSDDIEKVLEIRNDPETYVYLHTPKPFSLEECKKWFEINQPKWFIIEYESNLIGYLRTSNWDFENRTIWIGCDIHKNYRRKGYGFNAYIKFLNMLKKSNWKTVKLSVLKSNSNAFSLYKKLNFEIYEDIGDSYNMKLELNDFKNTKKGIKVIACYFGNRRFDPKNENPQNASDAYTMLHFIWKMEQNIDQGYPHDTCFVLNDLLPSDPRSDDVEVEKCKKLLLSFNDQKTANGKAIVLTRPNIGLSFAAFDHAFNLFKEFYDFWFFTEDDQIIIKNNTFSHSLMQLHIPKENIPNGFVASVGVNREWGPGAAGGCGVTSREILEKVTKNNFSNYLNRGSLHFHYVPDLQNNVVQTTNGHEWSGEVMFTKSIYDLGYYLEECDSPEINISWKDTRFNGRRTTRCRPYEKWMDNIDLDISNIMVRLQNAELIKTNIIKKLNGTWIQENGDIIKFNDKEILFNNSNSGKIKINENDVEIIWWNGIIYKMQMDCIENNKDKIKILDSNNNIFYISPHN